MRQPFREVEEGKKRLLRPHGQAKLRCNRLNTRLTAHFDEIDPAESFDPEELGYRCPDLESLDP
jgi:hypothetical protein